MVGGLTDYSRERSMGNELSQVKWRSMLFAVCIAGAGCFGSVGMAHATQLRAAVETGVATPDIADPVAYLGGVSVLAYFDDSFGGYFGLWGMGFPAKAADYMSDYDSALGGGLGVEYRLNVARGVPYLRAGGGIIAAAGSPSVSAPTVELGVGMRWLETY